MNLRAISKRIIWRIIYNVYNSFFVYWTLIFTQILLIIISEILTDLHWVSALWWIIMQQYHINVKIIVVTIENLQEKMFLLVKSLCSCIYIPRYCGGKNSVFILLTLVRENRENCSKCSCKWFYESSVKILCVCF